MNEPSQPISPSQGGTQPMGPSQPAIAPWLLIVFIIVVLAGGGYLGWYYYSQSKTPATTETPAVTEPTTTPTTSTDATSTADWKTYTNDTYKFSVKYPKDWQTKEKSGSNFDQSVISLSSPETIKGIEETKAKQLTFGPTEDISIYFYNSVADEPENKANNFGATTLNELITKDIMIQKIGNTKLDGIDATEVIWAGESTYYTILAVKDNHLYKIFFGNRTGKDKVSAIENQILSTFQFTP